MPFTNEQLERYSRHIILKEIYYVPNNNEFIGLKKTLNSVIIKYYKKKL